jgi:hypothetical protein
MISGINGSGLTSAITAGQNGLRQASDGITQAATNIAQQNTNTAELPSASDNVASDLLSLNVNALSAQASAKVIDVANDTLGTIIDTIA